MASLRRKPDPAAVAIDPDPPSAPAPSPAPAPAPAPAPSPFLKEQLESLQRAETWQQRQAQEAQRQAEIMAAANERRASWLASNQAAQENYAALDSIHQSAVNSGLVDCSPQYFDYLDDRLAALQDRQRRPERLVEEMQAMAAQDRPERPQPVPSPNRIVSAPVSRDVPSGYNSPSRVRLTQEQIEVAKRAGISETEYAKQLLKLSEMQASGEYSERR